MNRIIVIGCGFAGASCCMRLSGLNRHRGDLEIVVIDPRKAMDFLPLLPDVIGRGVNADFLRYDTEKFLKNLGCHFVNDEVRALDLSRREVSTSLNKFNYDYLVISSGSETNFYGNDTLKQCVYKMDSIKDASRIKAVIGEGIFDAYLICGAGYTGIEIATNLWLYLKKLSLDRRIVIVERSSSILGPLPEWMKDFARRNLRQMRIEVITGASIDKAQNNDIYLTNGESFTNAMLVWAAGVKTSDFIQKLTNKKNPQGRLEVDEYLRLNDNSFAVGDAALFEHDKGFLRMGVQFSIGQGERVAQNLILRIDGKPLRKYRPRDMGYVIPMANNSSCGRVLGVNLRGFFPTWLHYAMCVYRSFGLKNKMGLIKSLIKGGER